MMKSAIWSDYFENLSPEEGVLSFREAGFAYGECGIEHSLMLQSRSANVEKTGAEFRAFLDSVGFAFPQGHLDFQKDLTDPKTVDAFKKEITLFQAIGVRNGMIHINGGADLPEEKCKEIQLKYLQELVEFVKGTDFHICIENLRPNPAVADADRILEWIHLLGGKNLGICLDTGHLQVSRVSKQTTTQSHRDFILTAGSYLKATHINGNDGTDDYHLAPYSIKNSVNWPEVVTALRQIGYEGLFNLEIPGEVKGNPPLFIMKQKLQYLKILADYMISEAYPG